MNLKKSLGLLGSILILGLGFLSTETNAQTSGGGLAQKKSAPQNLVRPMFVDENGDGICDLFRDHDNDGIPNCQDPDWSRPEDGTGYKNRNGQKGQNNHGARHQNKGGQGWDNNSFRNGQGSLGGGVCDGLGPKGKVNRKGRG